MTHENEYEQTVAEEVIEALVVAANFVEFEAFAIGWNLDRLREVIAKAKAQGFVNG